MTSQFYCGDLGLIPGWGTKITLAVQCNKKKKNKKKKSVLLKDMDTLWLWKEILFRQETLSTVRNLGLPSTSAFSLLETSASPLTEVTKLHSPDRYAPPL